MEIRLQSVSRGGGVGGAGFDPADEVSQLAREFYNMATALLEREKMVETQRRRLEEQNRQLLDMGQMNESILRSIKSILLVTDLDGQITQCNPVAAEWLGADAGAIIGEMGMIDEGARSATVVAKSDCKLVPIAKNRSASADARIARSINSGTSACPKEMVALFRMPPQSRHGGSSSPARTRSSAFCIGAVIPQAMHTTLRTVP